MAQEDDLGHRVESCHAHHTGLRAHDDISPFHHRAHLAHRPLTARTPHPRLALKARYEIRTAAIPYRDDAPIGVGLQDVFPDARAVGIEFVRTTRTGEIPEDEFLDAGFRHASAFLLT